MIKDSVILPGSTSQRIRHYSTISACIWKIKEKSTKNPFHSISLTFSAFPSPFVHPFSKPSFTSPYFTLHPSSFTSHFSHFSLSFASFNLSDVCFFEANPGRQKKEMTRKCSTTPMTRDVFKRDVHVIDMAVLLGVEGESNASCKVCVHT